MKAWIPLLLLSWVRNGAATVVQETPLFQGVALINILESIRSPSFSETEFDELWLKYWISKKEVRSTDPAQWNKELEEMLDIAINLESTAVLRALLSLEDPDSETTTLVFNPNRALYKVVISTSLDETVAARMVRASVENGAVPTMVGLDNDLEYAGLTCLEIAIRNRRPQVVHALLQEPSPIEFSVLEEIGEKDEMAKRGIEVYRTRIIRETIEAKRKAKLHGIILLGGGKGGRRTSESVAVEKIIKMLVDARAFVFAERYLDSLLIAVIYLMFLFTLIQFLFNLRVKRTPVNSRLMVPTVDPTTGYLSMEGIVATCYTLLTGIPTAYVFESLSIGIASIGSVLWCERYTNRTDLSTLLVLTIVVQSCFTLGCYYAYCPTTVSANDSRTNDPFGFMDYYHDDEGLSQQVIMFYPKSRDYQSAVFNAAVYIISYSTAIFLMFAALNPLQAMYFCPGVSVSDTYGFPGSFTRVMATAWDLIILFVITLRIYRAIETVVVFDVIGKLLKKSKSESSNDLTMTDGDLVVGVKPVFVA